MAKKKRERKNSYLLLFENKYLEQAREDYVGIYLEEVESDGVPEHGMYFPNSEIDFDEIYVEGNKICVSFNIYPLQKITGQSVTEIGYMSLEIPIEVDTVLPMIEYYQKQVNKLKTILEASKEVD
jgi:hypothetical protein